MKKIEISNIEAQRNMLVKMKANFKVVISGTTQKIIYNDRMYIHTSSDFSLKELNFIRRVRNDVIKNCEAYEKKHGSVKEDRCPYVNWKNKLPHSCERVIEIDLNAAYWHLSHRLGYISTAIFKEGLKVSKKCRLAALGSSAKHEKIFEFVNGELSDVKSERGRYAYSFHNVSSHVYNVMAACQYILGGDYLFFWVDAIFFKYSKENVKNVRDLLDELGLEYKHFFIEKFIFSKSDRKITVECSGHKRSVRTFNISKSA